MALQCDDCGYKGKKAVEGGCPACGSRSFRAPRRKREKVKEPQPIRTAFMILLWGVLLYKLYQFTFS
ncbi:hypothetical protein TDB9533_01141 [Thalassocella blandensis]|nr:hypothetical protein TDB9533_01141 [Thalassocella blandensis]